MVRAACDAKTVANDELSAWLCFDGAIDGNLSVADQVLGLASAAGLSRSLDGLGHSDMVRMNREVRHEVSPKGKIKKA
jgi:hypothetical protein